MYQILLTKICEIVDSTEDKNHKLLKICNLLKDTIAYFDWVGFYFLEPSKYELVLGPYVGEPTEHVRILLGRGICGQAAEKKGTMVVQDVSVEQNYISCSTKVKSEIVVPIFKNGEVIGELDIDSLTLAPFTKGDREFLEEVCKFAAEILKNNL